MIYKSKPVGKHALSINLDEINSVVVIDGFHQKFKADNYGYIDFAGSENSVVTV
jgi:hypothetical protein